MAPDVNANAKGVFYGFTLHHRKAHFVRAIMESLGYVLMRNLEALEDMDIRVDEIRSLGRRCAQRCLESDQIGYYRTAADYGKVQGGGELRRGDPGRQGHGALCEREEACKGMVFVDRVYEPNAAHRDAYDQGYLRYKQLFRDLTEMFGRG